MEIDNIRDVIGLMKENELTEIKIIEGETRIFLKRGCDTPVVAMSAPAPQFHAPVAQAAPAAPASAAAPEVPVGPTIDSPMVGTFYAAPSPDAAPFARVGDHVNADSVVCIVEAMKVMNEIKAEISGTIEKILAKNAQPVEFGQPMFVIKPD